MTLKQWKEDAQVIARCLKNYKRVYKEICILGANPATHLSVLTVLNEENMAFGLCSYIAHKEHAYYMERGTITTGISGLRWIRKYIKKHSLDTWWGECANEVRSVPEQIDCIKFRIDILAKELKHTRAMIKKIALKQ